MKIIEALKKVKYNRQKMSDLSLLIRKNCAHMESQKGHTQYNDPKSSVKEWLQSIHSLQSDNAKLLLSIQKTNAETEVSVEVEDGKPVTKTISEWIIRRREGVDQDWQAYDALRTNLKQQAMKTEEGEIIVDNVVYNFSTEDRDKKLMSLSEEKTRIDSALEIANATTELL